MNKETKIFLATTATAVGLGGGLIAADRGMASQEPTNPVSAEPTKSYVLTENNPHQEPKIPSEQKIVIGFDENKPNLAPGLVRIPAGSKIDTSFWKPEAKQMVYGEGRSSIVAGNIKIISAPYYGAIYQNLNDGSLYATEIGDRPDYILPDQPINAWGWRLWQEGGKYVLSVTTTRTIEQWSSANGINWSLDSSVPAPMPR